MRRSHLVLFFVMCVSVIASAQQLTVASFPQWQNTNTQFAVAADGPAILLGAPPNARHNEIIYRDFKMNGYQVISVYRPDLMQDQVFYVDEEGNGSHWSLAPTAGANMTAFTGAGRDSFNPTGASCVVDALVIGGLNALFSGKANQLFRSRNARP
ncbi:MAG: hypothetical protein AAGA85_05695 [Bacteroidota bacterium]